MTQLLAAGEVGRLKAASSVSASDTILVYQSGSLVKATPAQIAASSGILPMLKANVTLSNAAFPLPEILRRPCAEFRQQ